MSDTNFDKIASGLPKPTSKRIALRVTPPAERSIRADHPWVYDTSIESESHAGVPGDLAVVFDRKDRFLAVGLYDPTSPIKLRVLHQGSSVKIDAAWFAQRIAASVEKRLILANSPKQQLTNGYRLINGESDGFPGLVADRYADTVVLKIYTPAWIPHLREIVGGLRKAQVHKRLVLRLNRAMRKEPQFLHGLDDGQILHGPSLSGPVHFSENGLKFEADPVEGQKTGFFLDQRENRARVEEITNGKTVLNVFSYTGGFSVYAARGGATHVTSIDVSAPAMEAAERNFTENMTFRSVANCEHEPLIGDAFELMDDMARMKRKFDVVILDPPMFAQSSSQVGQALLAYQRLTRMGLDVLAFGGTLVQASCSNRVSAETFFAAVEEAANGYKRTLRDVKCTGHAIDHPIAFEGGAYLKCIFGRA